jgi:glycosyltransferase involved in cell wall biosynthesis
MVGWKPRSRDSNIASVRYRCLIPLLELQKRNFSVELFDPARENTYSGVIFSKSYEQADQDLARRLRADGKVVVLDLCDNHFYNPYGLPAYERARKDLLEMIRLADLHVCSTSALADVVAAEGGLRQRPAVVGDPVEFPNMVPSNGRWWSRLSPYRWKRRSRLLWFGIHGSPNATCGMSDICKVAEVLRLVGKEHSFELIVCSDSKEDYVNLIRPLKDIESSYVEYQKETFPALLGGMEGVILPVNQNPFTWAKSHNRLTTALFAGVPVVADGVPSYREFAEFCTLDDWPTGLREILAEPRTARQKALRGREYIERRWMPSHVAERWREVLLPVLNVSASSPSSK